MMAPMHPLKRFAGDRRGVAAVEFAFVAPILVVFYLGMAETCQLLKAKRRVDHAAAAIADLVTQEQAVDIAKLTALKSISATILEPLSTTPFTVQITSVRADAAGDPKCRFGWPTACAIDAIPPMAIVTPLNPGEGLIVAQVSYTYTSNIGYLITSGRTLTHKAELRPRKNEFIDCTDC